MQIVSPETHKSLLSFVLSFVVLFGGCSTTKPQQAGPSEQGSGPTAQQGPPQQAGPTEQGADLTGQQGNHQHPCPAGQHRFVQPNTGSESCVKNGTIGANPNQSN